MAVDVDTGDYCQLKTELYHSSFAAAEGEAGAVVGVIGELVMQENHWLL